MPNERPPTIDHHAAARWQSLLPTASPWLHEEVARRMEERLALIRLQPAAWAHWEPLSGGMAAHTLLTARYKSAECFMAMADMKHREYAINKIAKPWWNPAHWRGTLPRFEMPADSGVQMVWANMALHMASDPQALMAQWHQVLATDGFLMFSCFGPDTLRELRELYLQLGWPAPSHEFTDMHDWGDMLVAGGFAEPVLDMERITLSYETPERLLAELRSLGRNLHPARFPALRGRRWRQTLNDSLRERLADPTDGQRLKLTFEVIYGHAIKPQKRLTMRPETSLSLDEMRKALHSGKTPKP
jgi:malonyl-CoA O-methyltransferase